MRTYRSPLPHEAGLLLVVPLYHVFGSGELSMLTPGVKSASPAPYLAMSPRDMAEAQCWTVMQPCSPWTDGHTCFRKDGSRAGFRHRGRSRYGLPGVPVLTFPAFGRVKKANAMTEHRPPLILIAAVLIAVLTVAAGLIWVETRLLGLWQDQLRTQQGRPLRLAQVLADMIKIFFKQDWVPPFADRPVFVIAPGIIIVTVLMSFAVVPFADRSWWSISTSGFSSFSPSRLWASTASPWQDGRPTTNTRSSALSAA